ncbi:MAG: DUF3379 family protein [Opitutales bacterium]|nr:DUF3379 family protein [Opitutales bacterium]
MESRRLKELLHAWRPGQDLPAEIAKARESAASDPALSAWLDNERAFDQAFAEKFNSVQAPSDLLDKILAAHEAGEANVVPFAPEAPRGMAQGSFMRYAVSIAASLLIVAGVFALATRSNDHYAQDDLAHFVDETVIRALSSQMSDAKGMEMVRQGMAQAGFAKTQDIMPDVLNGFQPAKYGVMQTQDGYIGQIGFSGNDAYRLIVMERRCISGCTGKLTKPIVYDLGDKLAVTWAKGEQVYILVSERGVSGENVIREVANEMSTSL